MKEDRGELWGMINLLRLNMEKIMLNSLRFNLTIPSIYNFLGRNFKAAGIVGDR